MASEADIRRALDEIPADRAVRLTLRDGTEVAGKLQEVGETVVIETDGADSSVSVKRVDAVLIDNVLLDVKMSGPE